MSWQKAVLPAFAVLLAAACGSEAPTTSSPIKPHPDLLATNPTAPNPLGEEIVVCKEGGSGDISFNWSGTKKGAPASGSFTIQPGQCWSLGFFGGNGGSVSITETVPAGQEVASITVDQLVGADQSLTGTNTVTGVLGSGSPKQSALVVFTNRILPPPPPPGDEGCTPGYWKNHLDSWAGTGYTPGQTAGNVFALGGFPSLASKTLRQTLNGGGGPGATGGAIILLRAGTAALLNAAHSGVNYTLTQAAIISQVNAALASGERSTMLTLASSLDSDNNLGCPLN